METKPESPLVVYLRGLNAANVYVDVETARRLFHILEKQTFSSSTTDWRFHRLIEDAIASGYDVLWVHVTDPSSGGWRKYPLLLDEGLYGLAS